VELTEPQRNALAFVELQGTVTVREVAEHLTVSSTTASRLLRFLHEAGLVTRTLGDDAEQEAVGAKIFWQIIVPPKPERKPPRKAREPRKAKPSPEISRADLDLVRRTLSMANRIVKGQK
jgi:DNA-binding Lrp family transcriptional regulator